MQTSSLVARMLVLVDGDILIYRAGYAAQSTVYRFQHTEGELVDLPVTTKYEAINFLKEKGFKPKDGKLQKVVIPEEPGYACHTIKIMMEKILYECKSTTYELYLTSSDKSNYRFDIAKTQPYKGNRTKSKPVHYDLLREYLVEYWKAETIYGKEADDALGIRQLETEEESVICTIDKDLRMIPGLCYNFVTGELYTVTDPGELILSDNRKKLTGGGIKWFYAQMLLGDSADNIPGIKGMGPVAVNKALSGQNSEKELAKSVLKAYTKSMPLHEAKNRMLEVADLLWIQRKEGERKSEQLRELL